MPENKTLAIATEMAYEVMRAKQLWPQDANSAHEQYAILLEEVTELQAHVFTNQKKRDLDAMRKEAIQVGAMAIRFVEDICEGGKGRN